MPTGHLRQLTTFGPSTQDHIPAFRIALSVAIPLVTLLLLHRTDLSIYATFGAFTALYARQEPVWDRFRRQSLAGLIFLCCVFVGLLLGHAHANPWVLIGVGAVLAAVGAIIAALLALRPAGSVFMVFAAGAVGSVPHPAPYHEAMAAALLGAGGSVLMGLLGVLLGEGLRGHVVGRVRGPRLDRRLVRYGLMFLVSTAAAGAIGHSLGISRPYWAMVAAAAAISAPNDLARLYRAVHRTVGTVGGILVTAFLLSQGLDTWHVVVWIVVLQFLAEVFVARHYAVALLFVTPMALLTMQLVQPSSPGEILSARMAETAIGAAVAFVLVLLTRTKEEKAADTRAMPVLGRRRATEGKQA